jgi:hypothetical protein
MTNWSAFHFEEKLELSEDLAVARTSFSRATTMIGRSRSNKRRGRVVLLMACDGKAAVDLSIIHQVQKFVVTLIVTLFQRL